MRKIIKYIFGLAAAMLGLFGHAQQNDQAWFKLNGTQQELAQVRYACLQSSQQRVSGTRQQMWTGQQEVYDEVKINDQMFAACMNSAGWTQQRQDVAQAQQQQNAQANRNSEIKAVLDDFAKNQKESCTKPEYKEYYAKTGCSTTDITFEQLTDETKITQAQKAALIKQRQLIAEYRKWYGEFQVKYFGELGRRRYDFVKSYLEPKEEANNLDLYNGKITWGQYSKARKEISSDFSAKVKEIK